jgi:hypothetical protein
MPHRNSEYATELKDDKMRACARARRPECRLTVIDLEPDRELFNRMGRELAADHRAWSNFTMREIGTKSVKGSLLGLASTWDRRVGRPARA